MRIFLTFLALLFLIPSILFAQEKGKIRCYTNELMQQQIKANPALATRLTINEQAVNLWLKNHPDYQTRGIITIPVVIHLLYHIDSLNQQLSDWQIISQIDAMNEDYARENVDTLKTPVAFRPIAANCQIQFCLAQRDPNGNFTTGIVRKQTGFAVFNDMESMKISSEGGDDGWPYQDYMNIWVCNLSGGLLGYTTLPDLGLSNLDGIVIYDQAFGRINQSLGQYNRGRTLTHESGHWLDLFHPWGDGGNCATTDSVSDTPPQFDQVFGCPDFPYIEPEKKCLENFPGIIFMDYMEYVDDSCMNIFTAGQAARMMATLNVFRPTILNAAACNAPITYPLDIGISSIPSPAMVIKSDNLSPVVTLKNFGSATITSASIYYSRNYKSALHQYNWSGSLPGGESVNVSLPEMTDSSGYQLFIAYTKNPNGNTDADTTNDFKTRSYYVEMPSGTAPPGAKNNFTIYPNPAVNDATMRFNYNVDSDISNFTITNILGQDEKFGWEVVSSNEIKIALSNVPSSVYFVRIKTGNEWMEQKFVVINGK